MSTAEKTVSHQEFSNLISEVGEMRGLLAKIVEAINHITRLDERQQQVAGFMQKLDDRMARMESRQHEAEIVTAVSQANTSRLSNIEVGFRDLHLERERDKARFQTIVLMVRGLWAVVGSGVIGLIGMLISMKVNG